LAGGVQNFDPAKYKIMKQRINLNKPESGGYQNMLSMEKYLNNSKISKTHKELIKIRASQINGCAFCLDMHTTDARKNGETEQRIYTLSAWRDTDLFTPEEQAILALTEEVTLINQHVSDATYQRAAELFDEEYLGLIIFAIITINSWNRIAITTGLKPAAK
jgi:AhpD family alkylhydroperoxidase